MAHTIEFKYLGMRDLPQVGGKNASLGEMISCLQPKGIAVPTGFATTVDSFREFLGQNNLDKTIYDSLTKLNIDNLTQLTEAGAEIRASIINTPFTQAFIDSVTEAYANLAKTIGHNQFTVAVRSSATAEDLPDASFAGQQETYLNVQGIDGVLSAIKDVYASLFNDRAITYRVHHNFNHAEVAISAGVQQMVRSDLGASGVLFTLDTESGFNDVVFITSSYGLGELVVQGAVNPDEFYVHKPGLHAGRSAVIRRTLGTKAIKMVYSDGASHDKRVKTLDVDLEARLRFSLTTAEIEELARQALLIEAHYGSPMDIEWGKDGQDNKLYILQARPETVKSRQNHLKQERYTLSTRGKVLAEGRSIGQRIGQGCARIIKDLREMDRIKPGDVLVTDMTDPDWEPVMKRAAAIVRNPNQFLAIIFYLNHNGCSSGI